MTAHRQIFQVAAFCLVLAALPSGLSAQAPYEPERGSEEWWALRANDPPGTRQVYKKGKLWPAVPRPTGPKQTFWHRYHHAHYWPIPYQQMDRDSVHEAFARQSHNGWTDATTLYDYHFHPGTNELNGAGLLHLRTIMFEIPPERRMVHVAAASHPSASEFRMTNVQRELYELCASEPVPPVTLRYASPLGRPAVEIEIIREKEIISIPVPRLAPGAAAPVP